MLHDKFSPGRPEKEGPVFELPIAIGVLIATDQVEIPDIQSYLIVGELSLDGKIRPVKGCLSMAYQCRELGIKKFLVPVENAPEAAVIDGIDVIPVETLADTVGILTQSIPATPYRVNQDELFRGYSRPESG